MNKPALKKSIIRGLASICSVDDNEPISFVFFTASGLISGTIKNPVNEHGKNFAKYVAEITTSYVEEQKINPDESLDGNDGYIILDNAKVACGISVLEVGTMVLFYDQIAGFAEGSLGKNKE